MTVTTNVPPPQWGPNGFVAPPEADVLAGRQADINAAFGGGLNPALETPQGQLASSDAAIIGQVNDTFVKYTNQVDPAYADGRMQDAIGRIYFLERKPSEPTVAQCLCTGLAGVQIPAGSQAIAADGNLYTCTQDGVIGSDGTVTLPFACNVVGPIPCPANSISQIYQAINGWDTITNPDDGVLGRNVESRAEFEDRRAASVASNSRGTVQAVRGEVLGVPGVLDAYVIENDSNFSAQVGNVILLPNSIFVAAVGGADADVASAIWRKKSPGTPYNGNTFVTVFDTDGYEPPYPSYVVAFERPDELTILFAVNIENSAQVPADALAQVQAAIIAAFAGADGGPRARIGTQIFASRFYAAVRVLGDWAALVSLKIGSQNTASAVLNGTITAGVLNVTSMSFGLGTLAIGQSIIGPGILPGTTIASLGSGTGGLGTYNLSKTQDLGFTTLRAATAAQDVVAVEIDQVPVVAPDDISLELS